MLERYATQQEFVDAVSGRLSSAAIPDALRGALAVEIAAQDQAEDSVGKATGFELRMGRWFIRDDDLPFFEMVGTVVPLVLTSLGSTGVAAPAVAGTAASLLGSMWRIWRKSGTLTAEKSALLAALKAAGGMRESDLAAALVSQQIVPDADRARELLAELKDVELRDGSSVALVRRNENGLWHTVNL